MCTHFKSVFKSMCKVHTHVVPLKHTYYMYEVLCLNTHMCGFFMCFPTHTHVSPCYMSVYYTLNTHLFKTLIYTCMITVLGVNKHVHTVCKWYHNMLGVTLCVYTLYLYVCLNTQGGG